MIEWQKKAHSLRLGYVPGVIKHYFHGSKEKRKYVERNNILTKYNFNPEDYLKYDDFSILIPTDKFCNEFKEDILNYFKERKEDD
jgi:hypothetical protein